MLKLNSEKIEIKVKFANTFFKRFKGLMFTRKSKFDYILIFDMPSLSRIKNSLHMLFVFYPIFAVFLDENNIVVDKSILSPFQLHYMPKKDCKYILEMPIEFNDKIKLNDKISW